MPAIIGKGMRVVGMCVARRSMFQCKATPLKYHALAGAINTFALESPKLFSRTPKK